MPIDELSKKLYLCYSKNLCYPKIRNKWNDNNRCLGMCAITSLIVNDYFGGEICKIYVDGVSHYYNLINNNIVDLTSEQFENEINYDNYEIINRNIIMTDDTKKRYNILKNKLEEIKWSIY